MHTKMFCLWQAYLDIGLTQLSAKSCMMARLIF